MKNDVSMRECLLCLRIPLGEMLIHTFDLYPDREKAIEVGTKAAELLKEAYDRDRFRLCGKGPSVLMGSSLYLAGLLVEDGARSQDSIAWEIGITSASLRKRFNDLVEILEIDPNLIQRGRDLLRHRMGDRKPRKESVTLRLRGRCKTCEFLPEASKWELHIGYSLMTTCEKSGAMILSNGIHCWRICNSFIKSSERFKEVYPQIREKLASAYSAYLLRRGAQLKW